MDEEYDEGFFARLEEISKLDSKCFNVRFIYVNLLEIFGQELCSGFIFYLDPWIEDPVYGDNEEEADEVLFSFYFDCNYAGKTK